MGKQRDFYVYLHRKATTGEVFYVGKGHGQRAFRVNSRNKWWLNIVAKHGLDVEIVISGLQEWAAFEMERSLIALYGRADEGSGTLVNLSDGGDGLANPADSVRRVLSEKALLRLSRDGARDELRERLLKSRDNDESKAKRLSALSNQNHRDYISRSMRAMHANADFKVKFSQAMRDRRGIEEHKLRASENMRLLHQRPEFKAMHLERTQKMNADPDFKKRASERMRQRLSDPVYVAKMSAARAEAKIKPVECVSAGLRFDSAVDAAKWLSESAGNVKSLSSAKSSISQCCIGGRKSAYGHTWRFIESNTQQ